MLYKFLQKLTSKACLRFFYFFIFGNLNGKQIFIAVFIIISDCCRSKILQTDLKLNSEIVRVKM